MRISAHEEICAVRYGATNARLRRIEGILLTSAGVIIACLGTICWALIGAMKLLERGP